MSRLKTEKASSKKPTAHQQALDFIIKNIGQPKNKKITTSDLQSLLSTINSNLSSLNTSKGQASLLSKPFSYKLLNQLSRDQDVVKRFTQLRDIIKTYPSTQLLDPYKTYLSNFVSSVSSLESWSHTLAIQDVKLDDKKKIIEYIELINSLDHKEKTTLKAYINKYNDRKINLAKIYIKYQLAEGIGSKNEHVIKDTFSNLFNNKDDFKKYVIHANKDLGYQPHIEVFHKFFKLLQEGKTPSLINVVNSIDVVGALGADDLIPSLIHILKSITLLDSDFSLTDNDLNYLNSISTHINKIKHDEQDGKSNIGIDTTRYESFQYVLTSLIVSITSIRFENDVEKIENFKFTENIRYEKEIAHNILYNTDADYFLKNLQSARNIIYPITHPHQGPNKTSSDYNLSSKEKSALITLEKEIGSICIDVNNSKLYRAKGYQENDLTSLYKKNAQVMNNIQKASNAAEKPSVFSKIINAIARIFSKSQAPSFSQVLNEVENKAIPKRF